MHDIIRRDRVISILGHFKGKKGYVARVHGEDACVVWKGVWDHGVWVPKSTLKKTKRYKLEQEVDIYAR